MPVLGAALCTLSLDNSSFMTGLAVSSRALSNFSVGTAFKAVGVTLAVAGVAAISMASEFQSSLLKVQAYVGMTQQQTQQMGQAILQMAPALGQAPKALADSLYFVASAGFKGADALTVLRYAGMTAAAANTSASTTGFALVASLNALGLSASQAGNISDELNATVKNGVMTWDQYGSVVGKIAGAVSSAGGSASMLKNNFTDLNAALDVYTNSGISARQASMWLSGDMNILFGKAGSLAANAQKLGLSFDASKYASMDFAQRLQYLNQVTDGNRQELVKLLGGNSTVANSVQFLNNHYSSLSGTIASITGSMKNGATTQQMFAVATQGLSFQLERAKAAVAAVAIQIGLKLLPYITPLVGLIATAISRFGAWIASGDALKTVMGALNPLIAFLGPLIVNLWGSISNLVGTVIQVVGQFLSWLNSSGMLRDTIFVLGAAVWLVINGISLLGNILSGLINFFANTAVGAALFKAVLILIATVVVPILIVVVWSLVAAMWGWVAATWAAAAANIAAFWPVYLVIAVIVAIIAVVILAIQNWGAIVGWLGSVWAAFTSWFMGALSAIGSFFTSVWGAIASWFMGIWTGVVGAIKTAWAAILSFLTAVWNTIVTVAKTVFSILLFLMLAPYLLLWQFIKPFWPAILAFLTGVWNAIKSAATAVWGAIATVIMAAVTAAGSAISSAWNAISAFLSAVWNAISAAAQAVWTPIAAFFMAVWVPVAAFFTAIWTAISTFLSAIWTAISAVATTIWTAISAFFTVQALAIQTVITVVWNAISSFLFGIWNAISSTASSIWNGISSTIMGIVTTLQGWLAGAWATITGAFSTAFGALANIAQGAFNAVIGVIKGALNIVIGVVNGMIDAYNNLPKFGAPNLAHIPLLAHGGMNLAAGTYIVGDAGPEILQVNGAGGPSVYPMTGGGPATSVSPSGGRGGSREIHIHQHWNGREVAHSIVNDVGEALVAHIRLDGGVIR